MNLGRRIISRAQIRDLQVSKIKNLYIRTDLRSLRIHTSNTRNNALHYLTVIKMIVGRFVGTGSFLIGYSNGHAE